ncbi:MAG: DUF2997 domain-containing protein [Phycisphaeraceae bacterium]
MEIIITPTGQTTLQTKGYWGGQCQDASRSFEHALGITESDVKTADYYRQSQQQQLEQRSG